MKTNCHLHLRRRMFTLQLRLTPSPLKSRGTFITHRFHRHQLRQFLSTESPNFVWAVLRRELVIRYKNIRSEQASTASPRIVATLGARSLHHGLDIFGSSPVDCPARLTAPAIAHSSYSGTRMPRTRHYGPDIFGCSPAADRLCQPRPLHRPRQLGAAWTISGCGIISVASAAWTVSVRGIISAAPAARLSWMAQLLQLRPSHGLPLAHRERRFAGTREDMKAITPIGSASSLGAGSLESTPEF